MLGWLIRLCSEFEERRKAKTIFKLGKFESYKQELMRGMVCSVLYEANLKLWDSGLPNEKIGEIVLAMRDIIRNHQEKFSDGVKLVFSNYETLKKSGNVDPFNAIQRIKELKSVHEGVLKRELLALIFKEKMANR